MCQENKQRLFEARLEALTFNTIECFNELGQVQPMLEENANIDEVCSAILEKYRNVETEGKKIPNRTMVKLKSQLIEDFFKFYARKIKSCPRCNSAVPILKFETMNGQTKIYQDKTQVEEKDLEAESDSSDDELELDGENEKTKKVARKTKTTGAISVRVPNDFFKRHLTNVFKRNKRLVKLGWPRSKN